MGTGGGGGGGGGGDDHDFIKPTIHQTTGIGRGCKYTEKLCFKIKRKINPLSHNCSNPMHLQYMQKSPDLYDKIHLN